MFITVSLLVCVMDSTGEGQLYTTSGALCEGCPGDVLTFASVSQGCIMLCSPLSQIVMDLDNSSK